MRRPLPLIAMLLAAAVAVPTSAAPSAPEKAQAQAPAKAARAGQQFVLSPEGNNLWAYHARTGARQLVVHGQNSSGTGGVAAPAGTQRRDINGQVCVSPDGRHVVTGEDTVFGEGSSHDPRIAGWGYHEITGDRIGALRTRQVGKLAPEAGAGPGYTGDPDNYGCGFLDRTRLFTTAIGNTLPGEEANGQLFLWFGPFTKGYREVRDGGARFLVGRVPHCVIDDTLATAGGVAVDNNGDVYVTTNRPDGNGHSSAVWRFSGKWPTNAKQCTASYLKKNVKRTKVLPRLTKRGVAIGAPTPSSVVISKHDTLYVASVFTGTVSEYSKGGQFVRDIYPASPVAPRTGPTTQTPYGLAVTRDGTLWIADLGIAVAAPAPGQGSVIKVPFSRRGWAKPGGEVVADGLTFPDGLGIYTVR